MNLSDKGWFQKYVTLRKSLDKSESLTLEEAPSKEHSLYRLVQPTGLMYGHPIIPPHINQENLKEVAENEKMKIVLTESLVKSAQLELEMISKDEYQDFVYEFSKELINYYMEIFPEMEGKKKTFWGKSRSNEKIVEEILDNRLYIKGSLLDNFWESFFHNSLLFLDVFYFREWITERSKLTTVQSLRQEKENMRFSLLKLIAAASYADREIQDEERRLFGIFLKSAHLDKAKTKEARSFIDEGLTVKDIDIPKNSWILRKYFLELAILTIWADQVVDEEEKEFIKDLGEKLEFSKDEVESSMLAIESFVITNWNEIHYLQKKKNYEVVSKLLVNRLSKVAVKNTNKIGTEIRESKELMALLSNSMSRDLTDKEKDIVKTQLVDILKMLPTFVIIALPGTFLTLPILLKVLPKSAFPSAFQE